MSIRGLLREILAELVKGVMTLTRIVKELAAIREEQSLQREILEEILAELVPGEAVGFRITVTNETGEIVNEGESSMDIRLRKRFKLALVPIDTDGNDTTLDGPVQFAASDPASLTLENQDDGLSTIFSAQGAAEADLMLSFSGDGDLGPGVKTITGTLGLHTKAGDAASFRSNVTEVAEA